MHESIRAVRRVCTPGIGVEVGSPVFWALVVLKRLVESGILGHFVKSWVGDG